MFRTMHPVAAPELEPAGTAGPTGDGRLRRLALIRELEDRFRRLTDLLYDTRVSPARLEQEVLPFLSESVTFTDPWQAAGGRDRYALGMKGFHDLFDFRFEFHQVGIALDEAGAGGRALVDGVMQLAPSSRLLRYRLRTILRYDFTLSPPGGPPDTALRIEAHEEMWSLGDMIEALPLVGRFYSRAFRPTFARGFLVASRLAARRRGPVSGAPS
jgi:hypothetical protein